MENENLPLYLLMVSTCVALFGVWLTGPVSTSCPNTHFILPSMHNCHAHLTCQDFENIAIGDKIAEGTVKYIHMATWLGSHRIVVSRLKHNQFKDDFEHNLNMLRSFAGSNLVAQFVGNCKNMIVTEYYANGNALNLDQVLDLKASSEQRTFNFCFELCKNYAAILAYLHNSPIGTRVMCDSNSLSKLLSQYLITDDLKLVVNDLDALPLVHVNKSGILCGHREVVGDIVAPEQKWPYSDRPFNEEDQPSYDERSDLWKIPDVCGWLLDVCRKDGVQLPQILNVLHSALKSAAKFRPTASQVLKSYNSITL